MRRLRPVPFLLTVALAALVSHQALAQGEPPPGLTGVFLGASGGPNNVSSISQFNPVPGAPPVALTPHFWDTGAHVSADTLDGWVSAHGGAFRNNWNSMAPSMAPTGQMVFLAQWFYGQYHVMAQDRDGTNRVVLSEGYDGNRDAPDRNLFPDISPDGQTAIYAVTDNGFQVSGTIYTVPTDGSAEPEEMAITPAREGCGPGPVHVVYSPDGSQIAFLGTTRGESANSCAAALWIADADGSNARPFVIDPARQRWDNGVHGLDWKADLIVLSNPTYPAGTPQRAFRSFDPATETFGDLPPVAGIPSSLSLSPDAQYIGFLRDANAALGYTNIVVAAVDGSVTYSFEDSFPNGLRRIFHWADVPPIPEPARLEFEERGVLLWSGRKVQINPVLYDADDNVISRTVRSYRRDGLAKINQFTHELWGGPGNAIGSEVCATNGGLERCLTYNTVNTPIIDAVVLDDEIAEDGRNPGRIRVYRYGRPDAESIPLYVARPHGSGRPSALHYLDYTLSELPERLRLPASDALADTLQSLDITLTPIDDGVAEAEVELGTVTIACEGATGSIFGPDEENCVTGRIPYGPVGIAGVGGINWHFEIASNGAGSGLAIATSSPEVIPASGQATLTVNGQGFAEGAAATLSGPSTLDAVNVSAQHGGAQALARFVLDGAPAGTYDLTVTSGGETATLEDAVTVEDGTPGGTTDVWATLQSRSGRAGLPLTQYIHYGNDGTADAALTPLLIAIPPGFDAEFTDPLYHFPDPLPGYDPDASPWVTQEIRVEDVPALCFRPQAAAASRVGRQSGVICANGYQPTDVLEYKVAVVFLPTIPPGGRGTVAVDVTKTGTETLPWFVKIGAPLNTVNFGEGDPARLAAEVWAGGPRVAQPTNLAECSAADARLGARFDAPQAAACAGCISGLTNLALTLAENSPIGGCVSAAIGVTTSTYQTALDAAAGGASNAVGSGLSTLGNVAKLAFECTSLAGAVVPGVGQAALMYSVFSILSVGTDIVGTGLACLNCLGIDPVWGVIGEVYSLDPNDKLGPVGIRDGGYVSEFGRMGYTVRFENLETATASAVEVIVTDTLDTGVYDLSTFELAEVSLKDTTFTPPSGLQAWTTFWDRRPAEPSVVRVHGALDAETGVVTWTLSDLDPTTYRLRTNAEAGFLPPNDTDGAGEGWVRFVVRARDGLPDGTVAANGATIRFDRNELIRTPTWANTLDLSPPTSRAIAVEPFDADTSWVVQFEGTDDGAGVAGYDLYVQADGGPFAYATSARADSVVFRGDPGRVYGFFAVATDWAGNDEAPKTEAEVTTGTVSTGGPADGPAELSLAAPYPNPARGPVVLQVGLPRAGPVRMAVYDMRGREVAVPLDGERPTGWHPVRWDASGLASGVYVVRLTAGTEEVVRRLTLVR